MGVWGRFWRMECSWAVSVGTATVQRGSEAAHTAFKRLISRSQQGGTRARVQWQLAVVLVGPNGTDARPRPVRAAPAAGVCGALAAAVCWARRAREEACLRD